jgi:serine/threonine-protein kinase RsbW
MICGSRTLVPETRLDSQPHDGEWVHHILHSWEELESLARTLIDEMAAEGFPEDDRFGLRLALEEAVMNAIQHGHRGDPTKAVQVRFHIDSRRVLVEVEDQGEGFDPQTVADPLVPNRLAEVGGRGLLLMRSLMTWIRFNPRGNCVALCKLSSTA